MEKTDKKNGELCLCKMHCFPDFHDSPDGDAPDRDHGCSRFQPLYQKPENASEFSGITGNGDSHQPKNDVSALKQYYQKGFENGQQEAIHMNQERLAPHLHGFEVSRKRLSQDLDRISSAAASGIAALSMAIAEKILGEPIRNDPSGFSSLQGHLQNALGSVYGIGLLMNCKDYEILNDLTGHLGQAQNESQSIPVSSTEAIERGTLRLNQKPVPLDDEQISRIIKKTVSPTT
jgi:flagellar biosynthesis/type III secretory pathway protein FliH